jgi:hypothetical protein
MIRLIRRMVKNLDRIPTAMAVTVLFMPPLAIIVGAKDVGVVWTIIMWGLLIYLAIKKPE